jgi:hypothetical protein
MFKLMTFFHIDHFYENFGNLLKKGLVIFRRIIVALQS